MSNLPKGWELKTLGELSKVKRGASPRPINDPKWWGGDIGWVRISDLTASTKFLNKTKDKLSNEGVQKSVRINKGEVILSICATIGRPIIVNTEVCIHDGFVWFDKLSKKVDREYFYYFLSKKEKELSASRQIGTQGNLNTDIVSRLIFPLPPIEEQKKIADILSTVDKKIAFVEENINATEELKKGLMQKLLTEGIGHTEFKDSELGKIPESWEIVKLPEITVKITSGGTPSRAKPEYYENGTVNWIKTGELRDCYIYDSEEKITEEAVTNSSAKKFPVDTLLIAMYGATIGRTAYLKVESSTNQACCAIIFNPEKANTHFYWQYFLFTRETLISKGCGAGQPNISQGIIKDLFIPFPPLEEQKQIAEILSTVDKKLENLKEKKQSFEELKKGLMQKLLTGEVRV
ncbi:restriction endonuclease subunit S [Aliarcobacter butzleri]|uniref:restriction endonuclease subunit S n=1 Tax=Aliarcobacter butzleri TaxID=28197 RepID=UPI00125FDD03|nr:restriction endonuclease subunit S [Aliarcobacter butzleri]